MIGYEIIATCRKVNYRMPYSGLFEGSPKIESKAKETIAKAAAKKVVERIARVVIGGAAGGVVTVADVVSKPLQGMGSAIAEWLKEKLKGLNRSMAERSLKLHEIHVVLNGDFEGSYKINRPIDLARLPLLLALIPKKGTTDSYMGESVLEQAIKAQIDFIRHIGNTQPITASKTKKNEVFELDLRIDL